MKHLIFTIFIIIIILVGHILSHTEVILPKELSDTFKSKYPHLNGGFKYKTMGKVPNNVNYFGYVQTHPNTTDFCTPQLYQDSDPIGPFDQSQDSILVLVKQY